MLRKFDSGVMVVIHNKAHSDEEVFERIKTLVLKPDALRKGISPSDAAMTLGIAHALAKEHLLTAESKGPLCRNISPEGCEKNYMSHVQGRLCRNFEKIFPASSSSLRRHVAASLMKHHKMFERNARALQPLSHASCSSSMEGGENGYGSVSSYSSKPYGGLSSTLEIVILANVVGKVMGKGGANIANIQKCIFSNNFSGASVVTEWRDQKWKLYIWSMIQWRTKRGKRPLHGGFM